MPSCWSRNRAWLSSSRNIATRTSPPSMTFCSAERAWMAARCRTRSMPVGCGGPAVRASALQAALECGGLLRLGAGGVREAFDRLGQELLQALPEALHVRPTGDEDLLG